MYVYCIIVTRRKPGEGIKLSLAMHIRKGTQIKKKKERYTAHHLPAFLLDSNTSYYDIISK